MRTPVHCVNFACKRPNFADVGERGVKNGKILRRPYGWPLFSIRNNELTMLPKAAISVCGGLCETPNTQSQRKLQSSNQWRNLALASPREGSAKILN